MENEKPRPEAADETELEQIVRRLSDVALGGGLRDLLFFRMDNPRDACRYRPWFDEVAALFTEDPDDRGGRNVSPAVRKIVEKIHIERMSSPRKV